MEHKIIIEELHEIEGEVLNQLSSMLIQVVTEGASIGFVPPMTSKEADEYWRSLLAPEVILLVAKTDNEIVGCVQLHLSSKQNGLHRAEVAKLLTHPDHRRKGIGRLLMEKLEERAKQEGRTLLVLDTREGDSSNKLYKSIGFIEAGRIPHYAKSSSGELDATVLYYKVL